MNAVVQSVEDNQPARVNGVEISLEAIASESRHHADNPDPSRAARRALVVHELLRQRAVACGLIDPDAGFGDDTLDALLAREVPLPEPTRDDCARYYEQHRSRFMRDELVCASHILFAITDRVPLALLRNKAEDTLNHLLNAPATFEPVARDLSNCPSAGVGGSLGQLARGDTAPEFEAAIFEASDRGILPRLVRTRFGFHIVRIEQRVPGVAIAFNEVADNIAQFLAARVRHKASQQYVLILASAAVLENAAIEPASSPLVQ